MKLRSADRTGEETPSHRDPPLQLRPISTQLLILGPAALAGGNQRLQCHQLGLAVLQLLLNNLETHRDAVILQWGGSGAAGPPAGSAQGLNVSLRIRKAVRAARWS